MNTEQFFTRIWRINSIIILVAGILAVGVLSYGGYQIYKNMTETRRVTGMVNVETEGVKKTIVKFGRFMPVKGTIYLRANVTTEQDYKVMSYSKEAHATRNYLYYDTSTKIGRFLVPNNDTLFLSVHDISEGNRYLNDYDSESDKKKYNILAIIYDVVEADTNKDSRLTEADLHTIALSTPTGEEYVPIINKIDTVNGYNLVMPDSIFVFYTSGGLLRSAEVDIKSLKIKSDELVIKSK